MVKKLVTINILAKWYVAQLMEDKVIPILPHLVHALTVDAMVARDFKNNN